MNTTGTFTKSSTCSQQMYDCCKPGHLLMVLWCSIYFATLFRLLQADSFEEHQHQVSLIHGLYARVACDNCLACKCCCCSATCAAACHVTDALKVMMMSSNGNIFRITGPLCGESTGHRWIPLTKASNAELWCFLRSVPEQMVEQSI